MEPGLEISTSSLDKVKFRVGEDDKNKDATVVHVLLPETEPKTGLKKVPKYVWGYFYAILSAFLVCVAVILMKKAFIFNASDHLLVRYTVQLIFIYIISKIKKVNIFDIKSQLCLLMIRAGIGALVFFTSYLAITLIHPSDYTTIFNANIIITAVLCRIFLKEKITAIHIIALLLTLVGVVTVFRPPFLFRHIQPIFSNNNTNGTVNNDALYTSTFGIVGLTSAVLVAFGFGVISLVMKMLAVYKVHYTTVNIYSSFFGIPLALIISILLVVLKYQHQDIEYEKQFYLLHTIYSILAALCAVLGVLLLSISFEYEDATKISIIKTVDIVFSFILQYLFLGLNVDLFGIIGALLILFGAFLIMFLKVLENHCSKKNFCFIDCLIKKF